MDGSEFRMCDPRDRGLNTAAYYPTLTTAQSIYNRAQMVLTVARQIQPDYISIATEPDTEATVTGKSFLSSPSGNAQMLCCPTAK